MKKFTALLGMFLLLGTFVTGQVKPVAKQVTAKVTNQETFEKVSLFTESSQAKTGAKANVKDAQFLTLDAKKLKNLAKKNQGNLELSLPYNGENIVVQLVPNNIFEGFYATDENYQNANYTPGNYYKGIIKGDTKSLVGISIFDDEVIGVISSDKYGDLNLGALVDNQGNMIKGNTNYVLYSAKNLPKDSHGQFCSSEGLPEGGEFDYNANNPEYGKFETTKVVTMYFEVDYDIYRARGMNVETTLNWVTAMFNNVKLLYENDDIQVALRSTMVWTSQDPYQGVGTSSSAYLNKFKKTRASFDANVGQLIGVDPGGLGGVAWVNALCSANNYSYSDVSNTYADFPTYSWNIMVITHEFGHNLGSNHTHACVWNGNNTAIDSCMTNEGSCANAGIPSEGGTIMSYCHLQSVGINLTLGFGPQPRQRIIDFINSSACLPDDLDNVCITYHPVYEVKNVTDTSAIVELISTSGETVSWDYKLSRFNQAIPSTWNTEQGSVLNFSDLQPNTYYRLRVRKSCDSSNNTGVDLVFATSGDFCSGDNKFTDYGGVNVAYLNNENWVRTLLPNDANSKIKVAFTAFNTEAGTDILRVYDGIDTGATQLTPAAGLSGNITSNLPTYEATNDSGALTFKFVSDNGVTAAGWVADVTCSTLGLDNQNSVVDFSYFPNPVTNELNIVSKKAFNSIKIISAEGKLVENKTYKKVFSTSVNTTHLPKGVYLVTIDFEGKDSTFKIVKK